MRNRLADLCVRVLYAALVLRARSQSAAVDAVSHILTLWSGALRCSLEARRVEIPRRSAR